MHHQWMPDLVVWEPFGLSKETRDALVARGHRLAPRGEYFGDANAIAVDSKSGVRLGACDPRWGGVPVGY